MAKRNLECVSDLKMQTFAVKFAMPSVMISVLA